VAEDDDSEAEEPTSAPPEVPAPRENALLVGHEAAEAALLTAYNSGRLSHAWLLTGPRGIGKATLAYRFGRFLFAEGGAHASGGSLFSAPASSLVVAPSHQAFRHVASGGHPDLLVVERGVDPKRRRQRREIVADEARAVADFLHLTSARDGWRVVIIDGADQMNSHAANSLLKILEEPPRKTVLLLVSDNPGRLLPTIRSRCRVLALKPLQNSEIINLLQRYRGDLSEDNRASLVDLAEGSVGRALELAASDGVGLYQNILNLLNRLPHVNYENLHGFADRLARPGAEETFNLFTELVLQRLARCVSAGAKPSTTRGGRLPGRGLDRWVEVWEKLTNLFAQAEGLNLDRKQVVLNTFFALEEAAR
jgi:DNA polymerase III subunit delta'